MKTSLFLGTALTALLVTGAASAAKKTFSATLDGDNEIPAVPGSGEGTAVLTVDDVANTICGTITFQGLSGAPNAMHIHEGDDAVASGGVIQAIPTGTSPVKVNLTSVAADKITKILTTDTYVNVHTGDHAGGEIRGQLAEGGDEQACDPIPDAGSSSGGTDSGTTSSSSSSSSGGGNDASTTPADAGSTTTAAPAEDDGCSTTGSTPGSGLAVAFGVGIALSAIARNRRKR
ncbi:MAG TPA: CHRD domain-containing protein [Labilithrix sp.]|nr:CHRD domain-containing protein [Labilithrix sp.]